MIGSHPLFPPLFLTCPKRSLIAGNSWGPIIRPLMKPFSSLGKWDIIFCRNVAIYFSMEDRKSLFERLSEQIAPGGCLVIGSTEFLTGVTNRLEANHHLRSVFYTPTGAM